MDDTSLPLLLYYHDNESLRSPDMYACGKHIDIYSIQLIYF